MSRLERGITRMPDGRYRARLSFNKKEYERLLSTLEAARNWRRSVLRDLERCPEGVTYTRSGWSAQASHQGRRVEKTFKDMEDAAEWQIRTQRGLETDTYIEESIANIHLASFVETWRSSKTKAGPRTMMRYDVLLRNQVLPYLGKTKVAMLQKKDIEGWVTKLASDNHGLPSITKATALVAQILDFAIDRNIVTARNPVKGVELPSPRRQER